MICVNCGLCCYDYVVVIVKKEYINEDIDNMNLHPDGMDALTIKSSNTPCPYLFWINRKSRCKVHGKRWYKHTPCFDFGQIEESNTVCRLGEYVLKKRKEDKRYDYEHLCKTFIPPKDAEGLDETFGRSRRRKA